MREESGRIAEKQNFIKLFKHLGFWTFSLKNDNAEEFDRYYLGLKELEEYVYYKQEPVKLRCIAGDWKLCVPEYTATDGTKYRFDSAHWMEDQFRISIEVVSRKQLKSLSVSLSDLRKLIGVLPPLTAWQKIVYFFAA